MSLSIWTGFQCDSIDIMYHDKEWDTVLLTKSDSDFMFCLQSYQGLIIDISLVY